MGYLSLDEISGHLDHPSKGPSSVFAILFAISCVLYIIQNTKYKSWFLLWLFPCVCVIFTAGYICLEYNAFHPQTDSTYQPSQGLLYSAVPILTAAIYTVLVHMIAGKSQFFPCRAGLVWFMPTLLLTAVLSLTAQGTSQFFSPDVPKSTIDSTHAILKASIILQLFIVLGLIAILGVFHRRCSTAAVSDSNGSKRFKTAIFLLYASATLILVRDIFRTVQIFSSSHSPVWKTEAFYWVFDAVPMLICTLMFNIWHPGRLLLAESENVQSQC